MDNLLHVSNSDGMPRDVDPPPSLTAGEPIRTAYSARAREYTELFGSVTSAHPSDRTLVDSWAALLTGPVLDAGCGPGQWTRVLAGHGLDVRGIDLVPEFVAHARRRYPALRFDVGSFDALGAATASLGGVLAWYSLIHHDPDRLRAVLAEFARVLRPGGGLLVGFFEAPTRGTFDHAVVTGYHWPAADLGRALEAAGFEVIETHTRTGHGHRPHGAITARRSGPA